MAEGEFETSVFVNCPFDKTYAPLLEAALFCLTYFGFRPRLANERLEAGENRLDKIVEMIRESKYSIHEKKFLIFEERQYDLKRALSDTAGQDIEFHDGDYEQVIRKVRNFIRVEAKVQAPGATRLIDAYVTFQAWMVEKKLSEGHSETDALNLPTRERLDEMEIWNREGRPTASAVV